MGTNGPDGPLFLVLGDTIEEIYLNAFVNDIKIEKLGLANKLSWVNKNPTSAIGDTATLYRTNMDETSRLYNENNYQLLDASFNNVPSDNSPNTRMSYIDYDISLNTFYKYKFTVPKDGTTTTYGFHEYYATTLSFYESPLNTQVSYDYDNESFTVNWDHIDYLKRNSNANMYQDSWLSYYLFIEEEVTDGSNNLVYYETIAPTSRTDSKIREDSNSLTITNSTTRKGGDSNVEFNLSKYNFYITPTFYQDISSATPFPDSIEDINLLINNDYVNYGTIYSMQNASYTITAPNPKNLRITSSYNNGKISFEWNESKNPNASSYVIKITNTDEPIRTSAPGERYYENPRQITVNTNKYTIDNSDLSIMKAYSPGSYSVVVISKYNNLTSENSNGVSFTIPVTSINFEVKFIGQDDINETKNLVNQVKRINLRWTQFGYATLYKLQIRQFDNEGTEKETLTYYNHPDSYNKFFETNLSWNYNPNKARFSCEVCYTNDHDIDDGQPESSFNELGDQWLSSSGSGGYGYSTLGYGDY